MIDKAVGPRCYAVFEKMAGVRGDIEEAIVPPKGLPEDISESVRLHWGDGASDWHTPSWFNAEECNKLEEWLQKQDWGKKRWVENWTGWLFGNGVGAIIKYPNDYPKFIEDVRVIFWFDN